MDCMRETRLSAISAPQNMFHLFSLLPTELRLAIWRECLPRRVIEIDHIFDDWQAESPVPCRSPAVTTGINTKLPVITRVCRESRAVAFERAERLPIPKEGDEGDWSWQLEVMPRPWLDRTRDAIHLNWAPLWEIESESIGDPLGHLLWLAAETKVESISISAVLLLHTRDFPEGYHNIKWNWAQLADLLRRRPTWPVMIWDPVVVHTNASTAAGLFGLLGDSRVHLVDVEDKPRIKQFLDLAELPGVTVSSDLASLAEDGGAIALAIQDAQHAVATIFGPEEVPPVMQWVIMFRLCTRSVCLESAP